MSSRVPSLVTELVAFVDSAPRRPTRAQRTKAIALLEAIELAVMLGGEHLWAPIDRAHAALKPPKGKTGRDAARADVVRIVRQWLPSKHHEARRRTLRSKIVSQGPLPENWRAAPRRSWIRDMLAVLSVHDRRFGDLTEPQAKAIVEGAYGDSAGGSRGALDVAASLSHECNAFGDGAVTVKVARQRYKSAIHAMKNQTG